MQTMAGPQEQKPAAPSSETVTNPPPPAAEDDSDPDFDDLDDVLDQFSANTVPKSQPPPPEPTPTLLPPASSSSKSTAEPPIPSGPQPDETEDQFIARLTSEMSTMLSSLASDPAAESQSPEDMAKMSKELEEFTSKMEQEGIQPEDLLKAILGPEEGSKIAEKAHEERREKSAEPSSSTDKDKGGSTTAFEDTIRRTMSRLETSDTDATKATAKSSSKSEEDMLAEMLKAMESGGGGDEEGGLSQMFLEMMQQLTHKDMLYEPMRELHVQYPAWLDSHETKLAPAEYQRYKRQSVIVSDIVNKFEQPGFSDDDAQCREYIWEKMQLMQGEGAPPEELVKNPFPGTELGAIPGMGGGEGGPEESCPTQ